MRAHPPLARGRLVAVVLTLSACACVPATATADLYWVAGVTGNRIASATDAGTRIRPDFISGLSDVGTLAVGDGYIYWTSGSEIGRARIDGTRVERAFIGGLGPLNGVAVTRRYVYWLSYTDAACGGRPGFGRATPNGAQIDRGFVCGTRRTGVPADADYANGIGASAGYLYWSWIGGIGRLDTSSARFDNHFITMPAGFYAAGIGAGHGHVYWGSYSMGPLIGRANLDGRAVNRTFIGGLAGSIGLDVAVAGRFLYFGNDYGSSATIARATTDGVVDWDFITGLGDVGSLAVGPA